MITNDLKTHYATTKDYFETEDHVRYTAYGIEAYKMQGKSKIKLDEIKDISVEPEFVNELACKFNELDLHIKHFRDVVYDSVDS